MEAFSRLVYWLSQKLNILAGVFLCAMVILTVCDVTLRYFRMPLLGTYELVSFAAVTMIGLSLPFTQWKKGHIKVDFLIVNLPSSIKNAIIISTRILSIGFFLSSGTWLFVMGKNLHASHEVSPTLRLPFYPLAVGLGICFFIYCMTLLCEIYHVTGRKNE
jgi:TRAP-type C4-dicarboxylate transport system permease small subunit